MIEINTDVSGVCLLSKNVFENGHTPETSVLILIISHGTFYTICLFYLFYYSITSNK